MNDISPESPIPSDAFLRPEGDNQNAVKVILTDVLQLVLTHTTTAGNRLPVSEWTDWCGQNQPLLSRVPRPWPELIEDLRRIAERAINLASPKYIGHMQTQPTVSSVAADFLASALNNSMLSIETSPVFTRLEPQLMTEIAALFGLPPGSGGVMTAGGTMANLQALAIARNVHLNCEAGGLQLDGYRPVVFASAAAHTSLKKAVMLLGLGTEALITIPTDEDGRMDVEALRRADRLCKDRQQRPFCIVATAGTTTTGSIDPLQDIATVAETLDAWLHVDAAYGGALALSSQAPRLKGIERAQSITFDPQKWMAISSTCAMLLLRDPEVLQAHFRIRSPYMREVTGVMNLGEINIQGSRDADVLKLWLSIQHLGLSGYAAFLDHTLARASHFEHLIRRRPFLRLAAAPVTNIICFRGEPDWLPTTAWDGWNLALQRFLVAYGGTFLSLPVYRGGNWLRAVLLHPGLTDGTLETVFDWVDEFAEQSRRTRTETSTKK